jgi:hypothetical protein
MYWEIELNFLALLAGMSFIIIVLCRYLLGTFMTLFPACTWLFQIDTTSPYCRGHVHRVRPILEVFVSTHPYHGE